MTVIEVVAIFKDHNGVMSFQEILNFFKSGPLSVNSFFSILTREDLQRIARCRANENINTNPSAPRGSCQKTIHDRVFS